MGSFKPQQIKKWPADRAVLLVHGIGNASTSGMASFPVAELKAALGADATQVAIYTLNYDFINDWAKRKTSLKAGIAALGAAIATRFSNPEMAETLAEYCGDILWPVLHLDTRMAIRDAYMAQLDQIMVDCIESMHSNGLSPRAARVSIVAHSLGCFHTYEALHSAVRNPQYALQPGTDGTQLESVVLMASPVQLMRTVANDIGALVPMASDLATLDKAGLSIPAEVLDGDPVPATRKFVSVTGTQDPVGGHLLGKKNEWAFMTMPGQETIIVPQSLVPSNPVGALKSALMASLAPNGGVSGAVGALMPDPHSWSAYMTTEASKLAELLA